METDNQQMLQLINVEGINIGASVFDTEQLSVIRGSSFLLKAAIEFIAKKFEGKLKAVSTGASSGLFEVSGVCSDGCEQLVNEISEALNKHEAYRFFTFVVVYASHHDFQIAKEMLVAKQRFVQLNTLTLAADPITEDGSGTNAQACAVQGNRAGTQHNILPGNATSNHAAPEISASVKARFKYGRDSRGSFYAGELAANNQEKITEFKFTTDIQALAHCEKYPKLNNKIAIFYLDGNGFSSINRKTVHSIEQQKEFDKKIQGLRRQFLGNLLNKLKSRDGSASDFTDAYTHADELRFETLLWGGDEMFFVVPAWMGFDLLYTFYSLSANWTFGGEKLTHAGGLVFCSSKTPITKIKDLARQLADDIKEKDYGRSANYFDCLVLESIDYPVESELNDFFQHQYGESASFRYALTPIKNWHGENGFKVRLKTVLSRIPRGQIYKLARCVAQNDSEEKLNALQARLKVLATPAIYDELIEVLDALFQQPELSNCENNTTEQPLTKANGWRWIRLIELWHYLIPTTKDI